MYSCTACGESYDVAGSHYCKGKSLSQGIKHDQGKLRYDLVNPFAHASFVHAISYGAVKYGDRNWELGIDRDRLFAAAMRHIEDYRMGQVADHDSSINHISHAIANLHFILAFDLDPNLPRKPNESEISPDRNKESVNLTKGKEALCPDNTIGPLACFRCKLRASRGAFCDQCNFEFAIFPDIFRNFAFPPSKQQR